MHLTITQGNQTIHIQSTGRIRTKDEDEDEDDDDDDNILDV